MRNARMLLADETGQGMVEYGLIIALVAVVIATAVTSFGSTVQELFTANAEAVGRAAGGF